MSESSALNELVNSLKQAKEQEYQQIRQIEEEKLSELSQRLHERLIKELNTIEEDITTRFYNFQEKLTKARSTIVKQENELIQEIVDQRTEITGEIEDLNHRLTKIKSKQWIIPTIIGASLVLGLGVGSLALGKWISSQYQEIKELSDEIKTQKEELATIQKTKGKFTVKAWNNAIGVKIKPRVWRDDKENLWIVQFD